MKTKKIKIVIFIIVLAVILTVSIFAVGFIASSDKIVKSDKTSMAGVTLFSHETEKGENIELSVSVNTSLIGEDLYLVDVLFDGKNSANYDIKNARIELIADNGVEIPMAYYGLGEFEYAVPTVDYSEGRKILKCDSDNGYVYLKLLMSGSGAENSNFTVKYNIIGKGFYSFNKFYGFEESVDLNQNQ